MNNGPFRAKRYTSTQEEIDRNIAENKKQAERDLRAQRQVSTLVEPEPAPIVNDNPFVWELVMTDMKARDDFGKNKYGTRLQAHNGRDGLKDAYQEILDAAVYLRQLIFERDGK